MMSNLAEATFEELFNELASRCEGIGMVCDTKNEDGKSITRVWCGYTPLPYCEGLFIHGLRVVRLDDENRFKDSFMEEDDA